MHTKLDVLATTGFVLMRSYQGPAIPDQEFLGLEYMDWKSGGDTNFAPLASAHGNMECAGFWDHGKPDKDGVWTKNAAVAPTLVNYVKRVGVNFGRVRVIKLNAYASEEQAYNQLHQDDNNRLNPDGEGWVVRSWLELTDQPESHFILREKKDDPATESRIHLPKGTQVIIDTERMFHVVCHRSSKPRYALITSWESCEALDRWIHSELPEKAVAR